MEKRYHRSFKDSIASISLGLILLTISWFTGFHFFYLHYYLFLTSMISAYCSYSNYAIINEVGLSIKYGPSYLRKSLFIPWPNLLDLSVATDEISWMTNLGGRIRIPVKSSVPVPALKITLNEGLTIEEKYKIEDALKKYLFPPQEAINNAGTEFVIKGLPFGGHNALLKDIATISGKEFKVQ